MPQIAATPVTLTALQAAWVDFWLKASANRPRDLRIINSGAALSGRACDIDALILSFKDMLVAVVEDTAQHVNVNRAELVGLIDAHLTDMAGDIRGTLCNRIHEDHAA
jgi:hypothetical protein